MPDADSLRRFTIEHSRVRGQLAYLDQTWQALLARGEYPQPVRDVLGQSLAAVALLASTLKLNASVMLQMTGDGPLRLVVVHANRRTHLRGLAHWEEEVPAGPLGDMLGRGRLTISIDPGLGRDRYQGIVELSGESVGEVIQSYFAQSEQLPTRLWLAADARRAAGLLLQDLPGDSPDEDAWERSVHLADTITEHELLQLSANALLHRLFHQEDVRVFGAEPLSFRCQCSRERVTALLHAMGPAEVADILAEQGRIAARCEFCNASYELDAVDVEQLFAAGGDQPQVGETRH